MQEWIEGLIASTNWGIISFLLFLLLGVITAITSCFNISIMGLLTGYSIQKKTISLKNTIGICTGLFTGSFVIIIVLGFLFYFAGYVMTNTFQFAGKLIFGFISIFFGVIAWDMIKIKLPQFSFLPKKKLFTTSGNFIFGIALGSSSLAFSLACCSPVLPILLSASGLQRNIFYNLLNFIIFSIGYIMPMIILIFAIVYGNKIVTKTNWLPIVKKILGTVLIIIGFYYILSA